jgi:hypothetical protein
VARQRRAAARKLHAAQVRRQKKLLCELGVPDLSAEEVTERARAAQRRHVREAPAERPSVIRRPFRNPLAPLRLDPPKAESSQD